MQLDRDGRLHLTYCTNIHAADGWAAVEANVRRYAPALRQRFAPDSPFGLGLRLSARDAAELRAGHLDGFADYLENQGLYVAIINGFPFGSFHRSVVKEHVYAPDWRDEARVAYTRDLIAILARLLPDGLDGGVSTVPLSYKAWLADDEEGWQQVTRNVARIAGDLARIKRETGALLHLDIEPEPDCVLETSAETIAFFTNRLLPLGAPIVAAELGVSAAEAEAAILDHIRVCFDCCHFSVEHEDPIAAIDAILGAGIGIGRIQLSSALHVEVPADAEARQSVMTRLGAFADPVYLHQVVVQHAGTLRHYPDLGPALDEADAGPSTWRIHFHVPLFAASYEGLSSTQDDVRRVIEAASARAITTHLEIETYTWDVLPGSLKIDLGDSIAREFAWVLGVVGR